MSGFKAAVNFIVSVDDLSLEAVENNQYSRQNDEKKSKSIISCS